MLAFLEDLSVLQITNLVVSSLSFLGSLYIFCRMSRAVFNNASHKIIYFIAMADFFFSISNLITVISRKDQLACTVEGAMRQFSIISSMFWTICLAIISYKSVRMEHTFNPKIFLTKALLVGILLAAILAILPLVHFLGYDYIWLSNYCWVYTAEPLLNISLRTQQYIMYAIFEAVPIILTIITILFCYVGGYRRLRYAGPIVNNLLDHNSVRLFWFPTAYAIVALPAAVDDLFRYVLQKDYSMLIALHIGITHSLGFVNALVYYFVSKKHRLDDIEEIDEKELNIRRNSGGVELGLPTLAPSK